MHLLGTSAYIEFAQSVEWCFMPCLSLSSGTSCPISRYSRHFDERLFVRKIYLFGDFLVRLVFFLYIRARRNYCHDEA